MKTLSTHSVREETLTRIANLTPLDAGRWGKMSVHQMVCHLTDAMRYALGERPTGIKSGFLESTFMKWFALRVPLPWPKGTPTGPEMEQGKGGTMPVEFNEDRATLVAVLSRFCDQLPQPPLQHPFFGPMTGGDWWRWGYLHADHHLRQFGR